MGVLQYAADLARVYLHSAAAGIPEFAERQFGNPANADATDRAVAQSRANTGAAGSVANVAGYFAPGGIISDAIKGVRALPGAVRAVPKIAGVVPDAERVIRGFVNPGRANAFARLGLGEVPTTTGAIGEGIGNVASNVANYVKAHKLLTAGVLGGGAAAALADDGSSGGKATASAPAPAAKLQLRLHNPINRRQVRSMRYLAP
jgi:hypothetical protein